jgi:hypothetical protein
MKFEDLLKACASGLPIVYYNGNKGQVTTIKDNGRYKGCAVNFGKNYDEWFHDVESEDKRSKYMKDLNLTL